MSRILFLCHLLHQPTSVRSNRDIHSSSSINQRKRASPSPHQHNQQSHPTTTYTPNIHTMCKNLHISKHFLRCSHNEFTYQLEQEHNPPCANIETVPGFALVLDLRCTECEDAVQRGRRSNPGERRNRLRGKFNARKWDVYLRRLGYRNVRLG